MYKKSCFFIYISAPDPPSNLTVQVKNGKTAVVYWEAPKKGNYTGFRIRVQSFNDDGKPTSSVVPADAPTTYTLKDLTPGATYSLQLFTVLDKKESVAYTSRNFTTSKAVHWLNFLNLIKFSLKCSKSLQKQIFGIFSEQFLYKRNFFSGSELKIVMFNTANS